MSDFFDDENLDTEENSSLKTEEKQQPQPKKLLPKVIALVVALAILVGGTVAVIKLIPEKEDETPNASGFEQISVLSVDQNDVSFVTVANKNGTFKFVGETEKSDSSESGEDAQTKKWYVEGIEREKTDTYTVSGVVESALNVTAIRKVTAKTEEECGLKDVSGNSEDLAFVQINKTDNSAVTLNFGDASPDNSGVYLKVSGSDDIYLVNAEVKENFIFDKFKFASAASLPKPTSDGIESYFENDTLYKFDSMTVSGKNYDKPLVIVPNTDKSFSDFIPYKITSPDEHYADKIDGLLNLFSQGVTAAGAYSYNAEDAKSFGLDTPDLTVTLKIASKQWTYSFKLQEDGNYAASASGGEFVYKVSADVLSEVTDKKATDYYSSVLCLFSIDKLKGFSVTSEEKAYDFGIKANEDEDAEDRYIITSGKEKIDCKSFQNLYQYVVSLTCYDYTVGEAKGETVTLKFDFKDEDPAIITFTRFDDTKYQYSLNGKPIGKVPSSKINKLLKYVKKVASGEKIDGLN